MPLVIAALFGVATSSLLGAMYLGRLARAEARRLRDRALSVGQGSVIDEEKDDQLVQTLGKLGRAVSSGRTSRSLHESLAAAGFHNDNAAAVFLGTKAALLLFGIGLAAFLVWPLDAPMPAKVFAMLMGAAVPSFLPNMVVSKRREKRRAQMHIHLPDAVDMLEICVSSGMSLDMAWNAVADEIRSVDDPLADEMELTNLEMNLGVPRAEALRHMSERTGVDDLSSLVALLVQSERFGASIVDALTTFARSLREERSARAEEKAEKMAVKLMFPMVMFIFPALLVVMVGPACIQLVTNLAS